MPVDIVDLTDMQKRGILRKSSQNTDGKNEFVALSPQTAQSSASPFDFLDNLASSAQPSAPNTDIQSLQNKIENLEYKLERLVDKIAALESKLTLQE